MIQWKTDRIKAELSKLELENPRLYDFLKALEIFIRLEFKKQVLVTCVLRTPEENAAQGGIPTSPHLTWEALDIRSTTFTDPELVEILNFANSFTFRNGKKTAVYHAVPGGAYHFHFQVRKN